MAQSDPYVPADSALLKEAILNATRDRLIETLFKVLSSSKEGRKIITEALTTTEPDLSSESDDDESDDDEGDDEYDEPRQPTRKRRRAETLSAPGPPAMRRKRYEMCDQCGKEYDVLMNGEEACRWHDGEREADLDGDFWADHDERCHGRIEDLEDEYPEGFMWTCCDEQGDAEGCNVGRHTAK